MKAIIMITILLILLIISIVSSFSINNNNHNVYNRKTLLLANENDIKPFSEEWARLRGMEPGYGGIFMIKLLITIIAIIITMIIRYMAR